MRKNKSEIYLAAFIIAVIATTAFLYLQAQEKNNYGFFPEKLGDMSITLYTEGEAAIAEVKNLHGGSVVPEKAYIANYRSSAGNKAKFWVSESKNNEQAASFLESMNSRIGKTGMFSESTPVNIEGIKVYFVRGLGEYHYFYAKSNRVFWLQINNPDMAYQFGIVRESIKRI